MAFDSDTPLTAATIATAVVSIGAASLVWWRRVRRLTRLRQTVARIHILTEDILGAQSAAEILHCLEQVLPVMLKLHSAAIFTIGAAEGIELAAGVPSSLEAADRCNAEREVRLDGPTLSLPMTVQKAACGVLQLQGATGLPGDDELVALQHLANQVAIALKLLDQRKLRDQLLRSEKLGAVGQLISSIAAELRPPLASLAESGHEDARTALETLERLISFGRPDQAHVHPVDLNQVLSALLEFRAQRWRLLLLSAAVSVSAVPLTVLASRSQLEQALLSLLIHAEQSLQNADRKRIGVTSEGRAGRALIRIVVSAAMPEDGSTMETGSWGLGVARGIIESHGGEFRQSVGREETLFEIDLPLTEVSSTAVSGRTKQPLRRRTLLLVHPDLQALRPTMTLLDRMDQRVVPASSAAEALEFASRFRFDAAFAYSTLPDLPWAEFCNRLRPHCPHAGLITSHAETVQPGVPVIHLPADETALRRTLLILGD